MSSSTSLTDPKPQPAIYRSPSNSSIASTSSGASLSRRPGMRARSRSRTVAGNAQKSRKDRSELPYLDKPYVQEPAAYSPQEQYLRPPEHDMLDTRDLRGRASGSLQGSTESGGLDSTLVVDAQPSPMTTKTSKAAERASSLPDIVTGCNHPPSSFLRDTPLTPAANVRDSVSTHKSATSSSVYPLSVSSASGPESPTSPVSLRTMSEDIEHYEMPSLEPEVEDGTLGFDPDDVSYRLRLLVKNNYFLPPAHSKPILSDLSSADAKKSSRAATPTFLDIFRVNKLKSKPNSPVVPGHDSALPVLRATGDSIMMPNTSQPRPSTQVQRPTGSPNGCPPERIGRVVVVREKMEDLIVAAKQAEQEIKSRNGRRDHEPLVIQVLEDIIDPTDAVDIPPPSPSYMFAMQTSALHGLGVDQSISAAVLAERLPPRSPGLSSVDPAEDDWRRSLLQAAVHHSLENTADLSSFSQVIEISTPIGSPIGKDSLQIGRVPVTPTPKPRLLLGQRILEQPFPDSSESFRSEDKEKVGKAASVKSLAVGATEHLSAGSRLVSRPSSYLPARVDTPTDPLTALTPPPPRKQSTPFISQSQTDLATSSNGGNTERQCRTPTPTLRKTASSPMLSDSYGPDARRTNRITPPPIPAQNMYSQDSSRDHPGSNAATDRSQSAATDSMCSEDEFIHRPGRVSAALSALMSRPSLSEYSQESFSPTTSAFQEDLNRTSIYSSPPPSTHQAADNRDSPLPRNSTMSPPPRISSSLAHVALPPPPRGSSLRHSPLPIGSASHLQQSMKASLDSMMEFVVPGPTTPPPLSERRGNPSDPPLTLQVPPNDSIEAALHSAPAPSSPTSFFDSIQSQPNALDDLDSSSDESDVVHPAPTYVDVRSRTMSNVSSPSRAPLTRLGNHSSPHISRTRRSVEDRRTILPFGVQDPKQPIANVPKRKPFFVQQRSGKSDQGHSAPIASFDFYNYSQQHTSNPSTDLTEPPRPATSGSSKAKTWKNTTADESLRRLDGLLQQHMVAEKDTIRRIAKTLQSSNNQRTKLPEDRS